MKDFRGDATASALSFGARAEYLVPLGSWSLAPYAAARLTRLRIDDYSFYSDGAAIDGRGVNQIIWTFPMGAELSGNFETGRGWTISPRFELGKFPPLGKSKLKPKSILQEPGATRV